MFLCKQTRCHRSAVPGLKFTVARRLRFLPLVSEANEKFQQHKFCCNRNLSLLPSPCPPTKFMHLDSLCPWGMFCSHLKWSMVEEGKASAPFYLTAIILEKDVSLTFPSHWPSNEVPNEVPKKGRPACPNHTQASPNPQCFSEWRNLDTMETSPSTSRSSKKQIELKSCLV